MNIPLSVRNSCCENTSYIWASFEPFWRLHIWYVSEVHTATLPLPVSIAGGLRTSGTPFLLGCWIHIMRKLWKTSAMHKKSSLVKSQLHLKLTAAMVWSVTLRFFCVLGLQVSWALGHNRATLGLVFSLSSAKRAKVVARTFFFHQHLSRSGIVSPTLNVPRETHDRPGTIPCWTDQK